MRKRPDAREVAAEIVRRATAGRDPDSVRMGIVRIGDPPTAAELLQLFAARMLGGPAVILPRKCATAEEWMERYGHGNSA